jgi:tRNA uridine 5-carboxymethylaminomethyl modification enzyme
VVVIGAGHAGVEAALASARLGVATALVTLSLPGIARMPCNPAIGGQGKGHLVREIDALGGQMALCTDATSIQFKYLNTRKGLAVRSSRAQVDRFLYQRRMAEQVRQQPGLQLIGAEVTELRWQAGRVTGVQLSDGSVVPCQAVVITTGTGLRGSMHTGALQRPGGGGGMPAANGLSASLERAGHRLGRLKTGTVPRLDGRTIRWQSLEPQDGDHPGGRFSFVGPPSSLPQVRCYVTATNARTHEVLRGGLCHSPLYGDRSRIAGVGPRYCPSIEDKIVRFAQRDSHRIFLEPEGLASREVYPNGFSTSLAVSTQLAALRTIEGLEDVQISRPGYAIEYDFADPRDLSPSLESRKLAGLYLAGQVNGTTGYEEAAGQGLIAGLNAALAVSAREPFVVARDEGYLGVMVDDLVQRGTREPYRMFTSRAEWRLLLREDNADLRLTERGREVGLVDEQRWQSFCRRRDQVEAGLSWMRSTQVVPGEAVDLWLSSLGEAPLSRPSCVSDLVQRRGADYSTLVAALGLDAPRLDEEEALQVVTACRYEGYISREQQALVKLRSLGQLRLPEGFVYEGLPGLRHELVEKLSRERPATLAEASQIPGVTPAAVALLAARLRGMAPEAARGAES